MFVATRSLEPLLSLIYINGLEKLAANWLKYADNTNLGRVDTGKRKEKKKQARKF